MSDQSEVFSRPNQEARIHDLEQYCLFADVPDRPQFRARLQFGERNGAPRISYFPNQEQGPRVVSIGLRPEIFEMFLDDLETVAKGPNGGETIRMANNARDPNEPSDKKNPNKVVGNYLLVSKDEEGVVWIAVQHKDLKNVRFKLLLSDWHFYVRKDGSKVDVSESSVRYTLALVRSLRGAMNNWTGRMRPWYDPSKKTGKKSSSDFTPAQGDDFGDSYSF